MDDQAPPSTLDYQAPSRRDGEPKTSWLMLLVVVFGGSVVTLLVAFTFVRRP